MQHCNIEAVRGAGRIEAVALEDEAASPLHPHVQASQRDGALVHYPPSCPIHQNLKLCPEFLRPEPSASDFVT